MITLVITSSDNEFLLDITDFLEEKNPDHKNTEIMITNKHGNVIKLSAVKEFKKAAKQIIKIIEKEKETKDERTS